MHPCPYVYIKFISGEYALYHILMLSLAYILFLSLMLFVRMWTKKYGKNWIIHTYIEIEFNEEKKATIS